MGEGGGKVVAEENAVGFLLLEVLRVAELLGRRDALER
jgi:hypothetical protein